MTKFSAGASPPEDLRVVVPVYGSHGDVLVTWKHEACRSPSEGYVVAFELMYCRLNSDEQCTGTCNTHTSIVSQSVRHALYFHIYDVKQFTAVSLRSYLFSFSFSALMMMFFCQEEQSVSPHEGGSMGPA